MTRVDKKYEAQVLACMTESRLPVICHGLNTTAGIQANT